MTRPNPLNPPPSLSLYNVPCVSQYDKDKIITGSSDTRMIMWDVATGEQKTVIQAHEYV